MMESKFRKALVNVHKQQDKLYSELDQFENVTRARRIRINIMLDRLANEARRIEELLN